MTQTFPDDSVQGLCDSWWVPAEGTDICRGRLVMAFVPHVDQLPYVIIPKGRTNDREHTLADCEIKPLNINSPQEKARLPVAGMPCYAGEVRSVYRAKKRPLLVLAETGKDVPRALVTGTPKNSTAPMFLGAPYYGVDQGTGKRAGFPPAFVERVRHAEYKQFFWDKLPIPGPAESLMRLEQIQPIGGHYMSFEVKPWCLSEDALAVMDEWLDWHVYGSLQEDGVLEPILSLLAEV